MATDGGKGPREEPTLFNCLLDYIAGEFILLVCTGVLSAFVFPERLHIYSYVLAAVVVILYALARYHKQKSEK